MAAAIEGPSWWSSWARGWLEHQLRRGRSPASQAVWAWALRDLGRWLSAAHVESGAELEIEALRGWQDGLRVRLRPSSVHLAVSAARSVLRWAEAEGLGAPPGLWARLEAPTVPPRLPRALDRAVVEQILAHYGRRRPGLLWLRDRALFACLVTSGARISEMLQLRRDQVGGGQRLVVRQKGGGEQALVISPRAADWLREYVQARRRDLTPALWVRQDGRPLDGEAVNAIWAALADELHLRRWTSHVLRHTAATEVLEHGGTALDVARHLGHAGLATVQVYARVRDVRRAELVDRLDDLFPPPERPALLKPISSRRRRRAAG